jgi:hypothetical protein
MRAVTFGLVLLAATPMTLGASTRAAHADEPAAPARPDFKRAAELYKAAEAAMAGGDHASAARDYQAAYDITSDPVLFYKIAGAHEKAGRCDLAAPLLRRYLAEGKPNPEFQALAEARLAACDQVIAADKAAADKAAADKAAADKAAADKAAADKLAADQAAAELAAAQADARARDSSLMSAGTRTVVGWTAASTSALLVTVGVLTALAAEAAEDDIESLLGAQVGGQPVAFTEAAQARYDELVARGNRYEKASWISLGAAGAAAVTAVIIFALPKPARRGAVYPAEARRWTVEPVLGPSAAGVRGTLSF